MKNILLPTDFSKNSINAINYAINLYKNETCTFYLLNVFRSPYVINVQELDYYDQDSVAKLNAQLLDESLAKLKKLIVEFTKKANPKHSFKSIADYSFIIDSISNNVKEKDIDLIVMGTKGATGAKEIFIGSNTGDVIMKVDCNLLAIPENATFSEPKEITFPTDYEINYNKNDLSVLVNLAKMYKSSIRVLHLLDEKELSEQQHSNKEALSYNFKGIDLSFHTLTNINFDAAVNCFTQSRGNIDLIAIVSKHYNFFQRLFFKPKIEELSFHTKIPLLILHKLKS